MTAHRHDRLTALRQERTVSRDDLLMEEVAKREVLETLKRWRDVDAPLVEAIGDTIANTGRLDSQEVARRVVDTVIRILREEL